MLLNNCYPPSFEGQIFLPFFFSLFCSVASNSSNLDSILRSRDITLSTKVHLVEAMFFQVVIYGHESWNIKQSWEQKNWCFWTVVLDKTLESPLDCKEIQSVHPNWNQSWIFIWWTDAEAETPILWPPDAKNWLTGKTLMLGKIEDRRVGDNRGWDDWMTSLTQWAWVWVSSGSWWWTEKPNVLCMGSQRVRHDWVTELSWYTIIVYISHLEDNFLKYWNT